MNSVLGLVTFFAAITFCHALFLIFAKSHKDKHQLLARIWPMHYWLNGLLWIFLVIWIILANTKPADVSFSFSLKISGLAFACLGLYLSYDGLKIIGLKQAMGCRFFYADKLDWISSGPFKHLKNPIYDGFVLILMGLGLLKGIYLDFYLAGASFILLNIFLSSIENAQPISKNWLLTHTL